MEVGEMVFSFGGHYALSRPSRGSCGRKAPIQERLVSDLSPSAVRGAWDQAVEHLRLEARWRAGHDVEEENFYEHSEWVGGERSPSGRLSVNMSSWMGVSEEIGGGYLRGGDVFEQAEKVIRAGERALGSLLSRVESGELA